MVRRLLLFSLFFVCTLSIYAQQYDNYLSRLRDKNVKINGGGLPIVFINVKGEMIQKNSHILAYMKIIDNGEGQLNYSDTIAHPGQTVDYEGWVGIKYRGNSSFNSADKKPFAIQTLKTNVTTEWGGEKKKVNILGMGKDNKWAMLAPWADKSMIRDALAFELGRPWFDFTPETRFCEVILDGTYYGVYVFTERVSKGKTRLNLHDPGEDNGDLTGDFLVEVDRDDAPNYISQYHPWSSLKGDEEYWRYIKYQFKSPEEEDFAELPRGTQAAIENEIDKMESSFVGNNWNNPGLGYRKYIDVTSFIDYMLTTELAMNIDGYRLSTNYYKYSNTRAMADGLDSRWKMSLWDFNIAYGNANYYNGTSTDKWQYLFNQREGGDNEHVPFYWYKMLSDDTYVSEMCERWKAYREGNHSDEALFATVDSLANRLINSGAVERNQKAWQILGRSGVWPCPNNPKTYDEEMTYLKNWLKKRVAFMDKELLNKESEPDKPETKIYSVPYAISSGFTEDIIAENRPVGNHVSTAVDGGNVFYTTAVRDNGGIGGREYEAHGSGVSYELAAFNENNALLVNSEKTSGTLYLATPAKTGHLYILGTSTNGASTMTVTINYTDGTKSNSAAISFADWSVRNPSGYEAVTGLGRCSVDGESFASDPHYCFFDAAIDADIKREISSVTFNYQEGVRGFVLAVSGDMLTHQVDLIPDMAEEGTSGSEDYTKLFDDDIYSKWGFNWRGYPVSVVFHAKEPVVVDSYVITTANDNATYAGRNPASWELYGAKTTSCPDYDDSCWELIDRVSDSGIEDVNFTPFVYHVGSTVPYNYFKWTITDRQEGGWDWNRYVQMSEFDINTASTSSVIVQDAVANKYSGYTYNLQGQKVGRDYKGVVIKNGKKQIVK